MAKYIAFVGPSYTAASKTAAYDELYNWFPERIESGTGPTQYWLMPTPGFANFTTLSDSPGRGGLSIGGTGSAGSISGNTYLVAGSTLYQYPSTTLATGIVNGSDGPVEMVTNGDQGHQLLFSSDSTAYCFDTDTNVLTSVGAGDSVAFLNSYGLRLDQFGNQFFFSAPFDFATWDPLDVVVREDASDNWLRLIVYHNEVWIFGARTTSIYYNGDDTDIPFKPIKTAFMNTGIVAPSSACIVSGSLFWLGQDAGGKGVVFRANGYNPERVSTHAIEFAIQSLTSEFLLDAEGTYYQQNGHDFYELTFPPRDPDTGVGMTVVYDATEGLWSKRGLRDSLQFREMDTRGYFAGPEASLSRTSGKIYTVITSQTSSFSWLGTDGNPVTRLRRAPHIFDEHKGVIIDRFELHLETGLGLGGVPSTTVGYDPQIAMRFSNNGGQTWSNTRMASAGRLGEFNTRAEWNGLGYGRDRLIEVSVSAPIPWRLIDAFLDVRVGSS